ncbi:MAG: alcohol dehydrogenase catalytic domain-containing protein [Rhodospirillaceae bacterium]|jgi:L-iditol 2-dehydrogenase|nr:alcohol dehydrogenase catalytic domain-containing protein [Rhodospirillaceae bacterium]MBT5457725.1 alcohol dehydrogenase catalytic domain-containing protein [Rhodospirillaceae bacterium]
MAECRAAVITAHNEPLEIQKVQIPDLDPGSLLVKITASTLCGTDVHRWHGPLGGSDSLPIITGHEPCGIVEEIAGDRTDILGNPVRKGDRIVWSYVACGSCYYCSVAVQPCICRGRASWGHNRCDEHPYLLGSVSEYMYVPAPCLIIKVPDEVSSASAAASACAYRTVMHGYDRLGAIKDHETVVIQGSGPLGNFAAAVAKDHGAKQVLVIGAPAHRLEVSKKMGADEVLDMEKVSDARDRRSWVHDRTEGRGADIVIQVANNMAVPEGLTLLRDGGQFLDIGAGGKANIPVESMPQQMTYLTVRSGEPRHWLQAIDFLASRRDRFAFDDMISKSYKLEEVNEAMAAMANYEVVKPVINF